MNPVGEENGPENGGSPNGKNDDAFDIGRGGDFLPGCNQFADRRADKDAFIGPGN